MREIHAKVFVGSDQDCFTEKEGWAVVHACKYPCHVNAVEYSGNLPRDHPQYLSLVSAANLFLNLIDPPVPLFMPESFSTFLSFANEHSRRGMNILVHCNQGASRAPSLALLFLAKGLGVLPNDSFDLAREHYVGLDPLYAPGKGIESFLRDNWIGLDGA